MVRYELILLRGESMKQKQKVTDVIWMFVIYILLLMVTLLIPIVSIVSVFFLPIPFLIYSSKHPISECVPLLIGTLIYSILIIPIFSLPVTLIAASIGLFIGHSIREKYTPYETIMRGAIGFIIGFILSVGLSQSIFDVNWMSAMENQMDQSIEQSEQLLQEVGMERTKEQTELLTEQISVVKDTLPATIMIVGVLFATVVQWISYKILNRKREDKLKFPSFRNLRVPVFVMSIYLVVLIFSLVGLEQGGIPYLIVNNMFVLLSFLILLHGLSFVFYFSYAKKVPVFIPILFTIFVLASPIFLSLAKILGIIDIGFRLRDRLVVKK